ncbi:MAG: PIG-L family deacetylase [Chloroflexi bacterium]|nr:PIG-L family deacetylase [Chloroflexota bacterium]
MRAIARRLANRLRPDPGRSNYKFVIKDWVDLFDLRACAEVLETKRFAQNLRPVQVDVPDRKRLLVIAPHPDDDTFGAGGTLTKAVANGAKVDVVYITAGSSDPEQAESIRQEAAQVCDAMGATPTFLGLHPKGIPLDDSELNDRVTSLLTDLDPDAIFISFLLDDHDDHRRVNELLLTVAGGLRPSGVEVWAYQIYSTVIPNVVVDITGQVDAKRELMRMWRSVSGNRDWAHYVLGMNAANSRYIQSREPVFAEAFFVVPIEEYLELCRLYFARSPRDIYYSDSYRAEPSPA